MSFKTSVRLSIMIYDVYAPWYDQQNEMDDLDFYLQAIEEFGGPVLEPGCGTGRLLIPIAREGFEIYGIDTSGEMRQIAQQKVTRESLTVQENIHISYGDMREYQFPQRFKTIFFACNTFQHLLTNAEQDQALQCAHRHLDEEGRLLIQATQVKFFEVEPDVIYYRGREKHLKQEIDVSYSYNYELDKQIQHLHLLMDIIEDDLSLKRQKVTVSLRYFFPPELERMLSANGFELEELYGDFYRNPLTAESTWMIVQARKKKRL